MPARAPSGSVPDPNGRRSLDTSRAGERAMTTETPARSDIGTRKHDLLTLAAGRRSLDQPARSIR